MNVILNMYIVFKYANVTLICVLLFVSATVKLWNAVKVHVRAVNLRNLS